MGDMGEVMGWRNNLVGEEKESIFLLAEIVVEHPLLVSRPLITDQRVTMADAPDLHAFVEAAKAFASGSGGSLEVSGFSPGEKSAEFLFEDGTSFTVGWKEGFPQNASLTVSTEDDFLCEDWLPSLEVQAESNEGLVPLLEYAVSLRKDLMEGDSDEDSDGSSEGFHYEDDEDQGASTSLAERIQQQRQEAAEKAGGAGAGAEDNKRRRVNPDAFNKGGSAAATYRLLDELESVMKTTGVSGGDAAATSGEGESGTTGSAGFSAAPVGKNLYLWRVKFFDFEDGTDLAKDLVKVKKLGGPGHIELEMKFFDDYPFSPPFIRVVQPRFQFHTGHVTVGGSVCMEELTASGWLSAMSVESLMVSIRSQMIAGGARVVQGNYTEREAWHAFARVAGDHKWELPQWMRVNSNKI